MTQSIRACPLFSFCGGCTLRDLPYEAQLQKKREEVKGLLAPVLGGEEVFESLCEGMYASPDADGYRNKMEFSFGDAEKDGPLTLGLHRKGGRYDVLTADCCRIAHEDFGLILAETLRLCRETNLAYFHKRTHLGYLRHLLIRRTNTGEILVALVTTSRWESSTAQDNAATTAGQESTDVVSTQNAELAMPPKEERTWLRDFVTSICALPLAGRIAGVLHTINDSVADTIKNERTEILFGRDYIEEKILGLIFQITPFSFFQTNTRGAEVLYATARNFLGDVSGRTVFDLYSGTGTIAQVLAPVAKEVIGVEIVEEAVEAARGNAAINGLSNCRFLVGDVLQVIDGIPERPDVIVLDPPRDGLHPKALPKILAFGAPNILYISCKPQSLARDLVPITAAGYEVKRLACVDLFPSTNHIETLCLLSLS